MVHTLYSSGANSIWEYTLLDPANVKSGRRKPNPKDPVHPLKADFIRAKYQNMAFVYRPSRDESPQLDDINKQLHSSVRTPNVETTLRLLSLGANPNYKHPDKKNSPLHMAAKCGQSSQIELLIVYGADAAATDEDGKTPVDYARDAGHHDLANKLVEFQFELTDRLAYYLCGRKPDHQFGQHFIIPEMADSLDLSELAHAAKKKLQALPNNLFEELAKDVYDEVDRRETDAIWLSTQNQSALVTDRQTVPFLPVNPEFSSTRNQGRQKLARFNAREFATLIIDILSEVKRRQQGLPSTSNYNPKEKNVEQRGRERNAKKDNGDTKGNVSDDEPLYDSVASDEEIADEKVSAETKEKNGNDRSESVTSSDLSDGPITLEEYLVVKKQLATSEAHVHHLMQNNKDMKQEISLLQNMIQKLMQENSHLRSFVQYGSFDTHQSNLPNGYEVQTGHSHPASNPPTAANEVVSVRSPRGSPRSSQRPQSMYEPRERQQFQHHLWNANFSYNSSISGSNIPRDDSGIGHIHSSHSSRNSGDYDNTIPPINSNSPCLQSRSGSLSPPFEISNAMTHYDSLLQQKVTEKLPTQDEVIRKTEQITKKIQELLISAQEGKQESFIPCSEKVYRAVLEMASIFPQVNI
ncbi:ARF GTPase-activating protein GIT2-like isoform X1 [Centruroides sculpturatus]|uniref:ARF GTPase-activating protein GIT2-like isoform X1 n=1 Tax=Centruroides sculpturatus TaxID=218467 RepID=UPI000C6D47C4|nr:ARF GTPase-activating protein GIT2-like isoform X1 [Centruroides sculpturatus]